MANDKVQVIMLQDVKNIWRKNEILNVSPSYAKHVLLAKWYAVIATKSMLDKLSNDKAKKNTWHADQLSAIESMTQALKESWHTIAGKTSPWGKLYAKIDSKTIAQSLSEKYWHSVDHTIIKSDKIDHAGEYDIKLQYEKVKSSFVLSVVWTN
jgi:large subunit ribosomal protein L9